MSPLARRFFGCFLPLVLAVYGCGTLAMLGYASQVFVQMEDVADAAMAPLLPRRATVIVDNTTYWVGEPRRGSIVSVARPEGRLFRWLVGLPGETVEIHGGVVLVDGRPCDGTAWPSREECYPGDVDPAVNLPSLALAGDAYFVVSQNWAADDSRAWGPVPRADIYGEPIFRRESNGGWAPVILPTARFADLRRSHDRATGTPATGSASPVAAATPSPTPTPATRRDP